MQSDQPHVYDKAKYHFETIEELGLPEEHAYHHTTYFLSWLVKNGLMSDWFCSECAAELAGYREDILTINQLYEHWDTCLISDMLNDEGNAFAMDYFDFEHGKYLTDYHRYLQKKLPSEFHVPYAAEKERIIHKVISDRYAAWKKNRGGT